MTKCACVDPNAILCHRISYNIPLDKWDIENEACDCICHALQEWDDDGPGEDSYYVPGQGFFSY